MRLMIGALLLASVAAVPAMAQDRPNGGWQHDKGGNHDGGGDHGDRGADHRDGGGDRGGDHGNRGDGGNRGGGFQGGGQPQVQVHTPNPPQGARPDFQRPRLPQGGSGGDRGGDRGGANVQPRGDAPDGGHRVYGRPDNGVQVWRNDRGNAPRPDWSNRPEDRGGWDRNHDGRPDAGRTGNWDRNHDGRPDGRGSGGWDRNHGGGGWNNSWRNDRRYDWRGWRDTHRDYYRVGPYRSPWGYNGGYRRWGIGGRIDPIFFGQDYWISDPDYYRLPPAYGSYRWVRYYNDALLVDVYSGTVIDEIPDFFW